MRKAGLSAKFAGSQLDRGQAIVRSAAFGALSGRAQIFIELEEYQKAINDLKKLRKIYPVIISNDLVKKLEKLAKGLNI